MTGVQTCALPICFPVTIKSAEEKEKAEKLERLPDLEKIQLYTDEILKVQIPQLKNEKAGEVLAEFKNGLKLLIDDTLSKVKKNCNKMKKSVFVVWETDRNLMKASRNLIAVCTSSRTAVSLVLSELLKDKVITTRELGKYREQISKENHTQSFETSYLIEEIQQNKVLQ